MFRGDLNYWESTLAHYGEPYPVETIAADSDVTVEDVQHGIRLVTEKKESIAALYTEIKREREYQDSRWGTAFDDANTANDWASYIIRYAGQAVAGPWDRQVYRAGMLKVAALAVAALETIERGDPPLRHYDEKPD